MASRARQHSLRQEGRLPGPAAAIEAEWRDQAGGIRLASLRAPGASGALCCVAGNALSKMDKLPEACEKYAKAVESDPRCALAYCAWGLALAEMGKTTEAEEKLIKAVELNPTLKPRIDEVRKGLHLTP